MHGEHFGAPAVSQGDFVDTPHSLSWSRRRVLHQAGVIAAGVAFEKGQAHLQGASRDLLQDPRVQEAFLGLELES